MIWEDECYLLSKRKFREFRHNDLSPKSPLKHMLTNDSKS